MEQAERKRAELTLSDRSELRALRDFLGWAAPGVRVLQLPSKERAILDQLTLLASAADMLTAVKLLPEFLMSRRTEMSLTIIVEGTPAVTLTTDNLDEVLPALARLLTRLILSAGRGELDQEQPGVDHAADQARDYGGHQPVEAAACLNQEGDRGDADEQRGQRVRRRPLDVLGDAVIRVVAGSPVQDEHGATGGHGYRQQFRAEGRARLGCNEHDRADRGRNEQHQGLGCARAKALGAGEHVALDGYGDEQQAGERAGQASHRGPEVPPQLRQVCHCASLRP